MIKRWIKERQEKGWFDITSGSVLGLTFILTAFMALVTKEIPEGWIAYVGIVVTGKTVYSVGKAVAGNDGEEQ